MQQGPHGMAGQSVADPADPVLAAEALETCPYGLPAPEPRQPRD